MRKKFREKSEFDRKFWVNLKFQKSGSAEKSKFDRKIMGKSQIPKNSDPQKYLNSIKKIMGKSQIKKIRIRRKI